MSNFYDAEKLIIERAVLAEDIILPKYTKTPLNVEKIEDLKNITSAFDVYKDEIGKFYIPILSPLIDQNELKNQSKTSPSNRGKIGSNLNTNSYSSSNYISLKIPKYIVLNFTDKIPKGTEFVICSIGQYILVENFKIIGVV